MLEEGGFDYGILTGVGLIIASAIVLMFVFTLYRSTAPANTAIALEAASGEVSGDVETVSSMAVPYSEERYYSFDGINVSVSADHVEASAGGETFSRPLTARILPGRYVDNGSLLWDGTSGVREYLNASFAAMGTRDDPIPDNMSGGLGLLLEKARRSTLLVPVEVPPKGPLLIEKMFIYTMNNTSHTMEAEPYVFVYPG